MVIYHSYPIRWGWSPKGIWSLIGRPWRWDCGGRGLQPASSSSWWPGNRWRALQRTCSQSVNKTLTQLLNPIYTWPLVCLCVDFWKISLIHRRCRRDDLITFCSTLLYTFAHQLGKVHSCDTENTKFKLSVDIHYTINKQTTLVCITIFMSFKIMIYCTEIILFAYPLK